MQSTLYGLGWKEIDIYNASFISIIYALNATYEQQEKEQNYIKQLCFYSAMGQPKIDAKKLYNRLFPPPPRLGSIEEMDQLLNNQKTRKNGR